jgi:long-chain fatty acid transport protein
MTGHNTLDQCRKYRMRSIPFLVATTLIALGSNVTAARPYPGLSGLAASADSAATAATNPAGITRFSQRAAEAEIMWFSSESNWESQFSNSSMEFNSKDSDDIVVPRVFYLQPVSGDFSASFTFLGAGFSDDLGDWPGRYFMTRYDSTRVSAFPSLAYRIDAQWSVAGSIAISYSSFEQERAVRNIFDPGLGDGKSKLETNDVDFGFGLSTLYQYSPGTRFGLTYQSEIEPSKDADSDFSRLGPNTEAVMRRLGIFDRDIRVDSTSPQSVLAGMYHEFANNHAATVDLYWIDFSEFRLSEYYFNGESFALTNTDYNDLYAVSTSYTWPVAPRWMLGVSALATNKMIDDDERAITFRLDSVWSVGAAAEWQWTDSRTVKFSLSYLDLGNAPVTTPEIPGVGSLSGEFNSRDAILLQVGMTWGSL